MRVCPPHCPLCYANRRGRSNYRGHWGYRRYPADRRVDVAKFARRGRVPDHHPASLGDWRDDHFATAFPALAEFLSLTQWEDGTPRVTSTLFLFCEDGRLKGCISDREVGHVAFVSADSFQGLLRLLEDGLVEGNLDWRVSKGRKPRGGDKRTT